MAQPKSSPIKFLLCCAYTGRIKIFQRFSKSDGRDLRSREWQQEIPLTSPLFASESLCSNWWDELRNAKERLESSCLGSHGLFGPVLRTVDYDYIIIYAVLLGDGIDNSLSSGGVCPLSGAPNKWVRTQKWKLYGGISGISKFQLLRRQRTSAVIFLSHRII